MGFAGKSGASATALGSAKQFGLVEMAKGGVRIGELGMAILEPSGHEEWQFALHTAANSPPIFEAIIDQFGGEPPKSDEPIRSFLIRNRGFTKGGADECIQSFRETFAYLSEEHISPPERASSQLAEVSPSAPAMQQSVPAEGTIEGSYSEVLKVPLSKDCTAELRFSGKVTEKALSRLIKHLELMKEVWAE
jgi:hypothetical protein